MTQVHFTLKSEEIQSIIEYSVKDDVSKNILTTVFNQLMENQRTEYIQAKEYERTENRKYVIICTLPFKKTCRPSGRHILFLLFGSKSFR